MNGIVVVGGGFAGVWSAASAVRLRDEVGASAREIPVTLISPGDDLVIRPRLYEANPGDMRVPLSRILKPIGVNHVRAAAEEIDVEARELVLADATATDRKLSYGKLILATGSQLRRPDVPGAEHLHDVDTVSAAERLEEHLFALPSGPHGAGRYTTVVVGSGFTGLEVACGLPARLRAIAEASGDAAAVRVILVERDSQVGPELGDGPRPVIEGALRELGIELRLGTTLDSVDGRSVRLSDGSSVPAATVIWTAGMSASPLTRMIPAPRDGLGRLEVDQTLRVPGIADLFVAGDTAAVSVEDGHRAMQSCQHAHAMGKYAGHNAVSDVLGLPLGPFAPDPYVTCLDLGAAGGVFTSSFEREVQTTGQAARELKRKINLAIYPPTDDAEEILRVSNPRFGSRAPDVKEAKAAQRVTS